MSEIIKPLLEVIDLLHTNNIIHREIKPDNIMFNEEGKLLLLDSGKGKKITGENIVSTFGTPRYLSPEVLKGNYNKECDMWSVGVILYLLVSGIPPFDGKNDDEIVKSVLKGFVSFGNDVFKSVSSDCKDLILKLLTKNPKDRITVREALNHNWFNVSINLKKPLS